MSARKSTCPDCREPVAACVCDDDPAAGACSHCGALVTYGPRGWRDDTDGMLAAYGCPESPSGWHAVDDGPAGRPEPQVERE